MGFIDEKMSESIIQMSAESATKLSIANPYVGPRTFTYAQRGLFFGREREARDLLARVVSERVLLFYAQSGAGKSSLLHTRLIPQLREEEGFAVLPVGRVSGELPAGIEAVENIYTFNLMASLDQSHVNPARLATLTLSAFLAGLTSVDGEWWHYVDPASEDEPEALADDRSAVAVPSESYVEPRYALLVDQFEEIITTHPNRWREREGFFRQLDQALLADPNLWVVLTLREDYVAALDPYAPLMADKLRARFYMERMGVAAALEAVCQPAALAGHPFADGVAKTLVDNLRRIKVLGQAEEQLGQYIEPVQLQVVCYQLWTKITADQERSSAAITMADLQQSGDVNTALADFYNQALTNVLQQGTLNVSERRLRSWVNAELITEAGTRGTVYQGLADTAGMPNPVVKLLADQFLLRSEQRAGGYWVELVHDRFVEPILRSNRTWLYEHQHPLTRAAQDWQGTQRDENLLLSGVQLEAAQAQLKASPSEFGELEREFIQASLAATQSQRQRRQRLLTVVAALFFLILAALTTWALSSASYAHEQQLKADNERSTAIVALTAQSEIVKTNDARLQIAEGTRVQTLKLNGELANNLSILLTSQAAQAMTISAPTPTPLGAATPTALPNVVNTPPAPTSTSPPLPAADLLVAATFAAIQLDLAQVQVAQTAIADNTSASTIKVGQVLQTTDWVNVRNTPGYIGKVADDVIGQVMPGTVVVIVDGPISVDGGLWCQIQRVGNPSVAITGWVAASINGEVLLATIPSSDLFLGKPFSGNYPITQYFGENPEIYSNMSYDGVPLKGNNKLDFGLPADTPVLATDGGSVKQADFDVTGFGKFIILEHKWGESLYGHLNQIEVAPGQVVQRGEQLGLSGISGATNGPLLSFGIRLNPYNRTDGWGGFSDPLPYLRLSQ